MDKREEIGSNAAILRVELVARCLRPRLSGQVHTETVAYQAAEWIRWRMKSDSVKIGKLENEAD